MSLIKRWNRRRLTIEGQPFTAEIKYLNWEERRDFTAKLDPMFAAYQKANEDEATPEDALALLKTIDSGWVSNAFEHFVRRVEGLEVDEGEDAPVKITTGAELGKIAPLDLAFSVLMMIASGKAEGGAASESPSPSPTAQNDGESPAPPASTEDGTVPATVPETPPESESSGPAAG